MKAARQLQLVLAAAALGWCSHASAIDRPIHCTSALLNKLSQLSLDAAAFKPFRTDYRSLNRAFTTADNTAAKKTKTISRSTEVTTRLNVKSLEFTLIGNRLHTDLTSLEQAKVACGTDADCIKRVNGDIASRTKSISSNEKAVTKLQRRIVREQSKLAKRVAAFDATITAANNKADGLCKLFAATVNSSTDSLPTATPTFSQPSTSTPTPAPNATQTATPTRTSTPAATATRTPPVPPTIVFTSTSTPRPTNTSQPLATLPPTSTSTSVPTATPTVSSSEKSFTSISARSAKSGTTAGDTTTFILFSKKVRFLARVAGPALGTLGVANFSTDPKVRFGTSLGMFSNDNWASDGYPDFWEQLFNSVGAFPFDRKSTDAAGGFDATAPVGNFSIAEIDGESNDGGDIVTEVYRVPLPQTGAMREFRSITSRIGIAGFTLDTQTTLLIGALTGVDGTKPTLHVYNQSTGAEILTSTTSVSSQLCRTDALAGSIVTLPPGGYSMTLTDLPADFDEYILFTGCILQ